MSLPLKLYHSFIIAILIITNHNLAQSQPSSAPLVQNNNMTYLGGFAMPTGQSGDSYFTYAGRAVTPYTDPNSGKATLFLEGHAWYPGNIAQIEIPTSFVKSSNWSSLPMAKVLQPFNDITDGKSGTLNNGAGGNNFVYGMLPFNGRLIVGASNYYDASNSQNRSHGVSSFNLAQSNDFQGFFSFSASAPARALGGYMALIPPDWRSLLGGAALTGNCCLSIIANSSSGPAATAFNPDDVGSKNPIPGTTLLNYPLDKPLGGGHYSNTGTDVKGIAFPYGSRSVLFFGVHTEAAYCYGPGTNDPSLHLKPTDGGTWCYDPCNSSKGSHGYPYFHNVWAYDANELLKVKNGEKQAWEVLPYTSWKLTDMTNSGCASIRGAGFDPISRRLYFTQGYSEQPRVDVYEFSEFGSGGNNPAPSAPSNLRTQ